MRIFHITIMVLVALMAPLAAINTQMAVTAQQTVCNTVPSDPPTIIQWRGSLDDWFTVTAKVCGTVNGNAFSSITHEVSSVFHAGDADFLFKATEYRFIGCLSRCQAAPDDYEQAAVTASLPNDVMPATRSGTFDFALTYVSWTVYDQCPGVAQPGCTAQNYTARAVAFITSRSVSTGSEAPVWNGQIGQRTLDERNHLTFTTTATDDGDPGYVIYEYRPQTTTGTPAELSIHPITGVLSWTPREEHGPGSYAFNIRAMDVARNARFQSVDVSVLEDMLSVPAQASVSVGSTLRFNVRPLDPANPDLICRVRADYLYESCAEARPVLSADGLIYPFMTFDSATGEFSFMPDSTHAWRTFTVMFDATASSAQDQESVDISVTSSGGGGGGGCGCRPR